MFGSSSARSEHSRKSSLSYSSSSKAEKSSHKSSVFESDERRSSIVQESLSSNRRSSSSYQKSNLSEKYSAEKSEKYSADKSENYSADKSEKYSTDKSEKYSAADKSEKYSSAYKSESAFNSDRQIDGLAPTFQQKPAIKQEDDGKRLLFECRIVADPKPTISWFHNGNLINIAGRFKSTLTGEGKNVYFSALEVGKVTVEDAGKYKVTAKNELGESNATISLNFDSDDTSVPDEGVKPTFTERPVIRQSDDGNKVVFECRLVGDPKPTISWFQGTRALKEGGKYKMSIETDSTKHSHLATLEISNVAGADGGEYKAVAKNNLGEGTANINLNFEGGGDTDKPKVPDGKAPRFPKKPTIKQEGDILIMECILECNPPPEIQWYRGTTKINESKRHTIKKVSTGKDMYLLTLEIRDPTNDDGGNYRCNAINEVGDSNANIALNFQGGDEGVAPTFIGKPKIIPKDNGALVVMECQVNSKPAPEVIWYRGTTVVKESSRITTKIIPNGDNYTVVMEIKDPSGSDGGTYRCNVKNAYGETNANLNLNIEGEAKPEGTAPTFVEKPKIISEDNGKRVIMECRVRAKPKPDHIWYKEGKLVKETAKLSMNVKQEGDIYIYQLILKDPMKADGGLFKCNVKNELGELNANLTLNVEEVPVIREKPKIVKVEKKKTVIIECNVTSPKKPECTWYREQQIVREDRKHVIHIKEVKRGEFQIQLEIEMPSNDDKGIYKLIAKNDKGEAISQTVEFYEIIEEKEEKKDEKKKGDKPKISQGLVSITVEVGESAEFVCKLSTADKKVKIEWMKNSQIIKETTDIKMSFDGLIAKLIIKKTTIQMTAKYEIIVTNEFGKETSSADLIVKEPKKKEPEKKEEKKPEEKKPEEKKPEEKKPEEKKPEEKKPEEKQKPELIVDGLDKKPEEKKPEAKKPEEKKPETKKPEEKKPEAKKPEKIKPVEKQADFTKVKLQKRDPAKKAVAEKEELPTLKTPKIIEPEGKKEEKKEVSVMKKKKDSIPSDDKPAIPVIEIAKEKSPEPGSRKGSTTGRRPSIVVADEKGLMVDPTGKTLKLRPGEVMDLRQRRGSVDARRASMAELVDKPSTALKPSGDECPAQIVGFDENVTVTEGANAYISVQIEGNPVPTIQWYKEPTELMDEGRYKFHSDGESNTVTLCIRKSRTTDEGNYKLVVTNKFGSDSAEITLFVSEEGGMDFRAMLKRRRYTKWGNEGGPPDWGDLKPGESELESKMKKEKKQETWMKPLIDITVKQGKEKKVKFEGVFSKPNCKAKWFRNKQECFMGAKFHIKSDGDTHTLEISNPKVDDSGKYSVDCMTVKTEAYLQVLEPDPVYTFTKKLPKKVEGYTCKETLLECVVSSYKAIVTWYKKDEKLEHGDKYEMEKDTLGRCTLHIKKSTLEDSGLYYAKIEKSDAKTQCDVLIVEQRYGFLREMKSVRVIEKEPATMECEVDDRDAPVTWYLDDKEIKPEEGRLEIVADARRRKVIIKATKVVDEGKYTCKTNDASTSGELLVEPLNQFITKLTDRNCLEREQVTLEAKLMDPAVAVEWFKNNESLKPSDRIEILNDGRGGHSVVIHGARLEDEGEYRCKAHNLKTQGRLTVGEGEKPPIIQLDDRNIKGPSGKPLIIQVPYAIHGTRQTPVEAKLMRNGKPVSPKDVEIIVKDDKIEYRLKKPNRKETSGDYQIVISNAQGEDKIDINVNVLDVPEPPEILEVKDVFKTSCVCEWKPPKDDGGVPVMHYILERQDLAARGGWVEVAQVQDTTFKCIDLVHKKEYKFRVRAVNKQGTSEPCNAPRTTVAKDPWDEPGKPGKLEVTDWDKDRVDLKWEKPENDGGAEITTYVIEKRDRVLKEWTTAKEVPVTDELACTIDGLKEGGTYEFRVRAVNKAGPGEPSDPTPPLVAKSRFVKPYIIGDGLKSVIVKKGQTITLEVNFGGEPPPSVVWQLNEKNIDIIDERITIESTEKISTLIIKRAIRKDTGMYRLILSNSSGTCSTQGDVCVLDKPTRPGGPLVAEEVRQDHVKLSWKKPADTGGSDIKGYVVEKMDMETGRWMPAGEVGPDKQGITVEGLQKGKEYKFRVKAVNKEGESEPLETEKPILAKNPYDEPGKPSKPEIVDWDNTRVDLKWSPPESDGGRPILHYVVEMKDKFALEWTEVTKTDGAKTEASVTELKENSTVQFRIRAVNKAGPSEPSEPTNPHIVKHRNLKPRIDRTNLKNITIKVGRTHKYEVDIIGEPPPQVQWIFNEIRVTADNIKIEDKDYHSDFTIVNAKRKDSGKYTIIASNASGKDSVTVDLTVLGKPSKPEGPLKVSDVHKEGCKLKWNRPKDDGGSPITQYDIEKLDTDTGKWTRCGKSDKPEFEVENLIPGKEYHFRVAAVNEEGDSEPLQTLEPIIAKNPYDEPGKPGPPELFDWDDTSVDLKWTAPKSDGGAKIEKYIIEKKDKLSSNWERAAEVSGDKLEGKVECLKEGTQIQFRVVAVNKAGPSQPSDATQMHMVKHRRLKPRIDRTNLKSVTVKAGKLVKYDINIRGEPPPKVTWKQNDKIVDSQDNLVIESKDYNTKLTISDGLRKNTGKYVIIAENEYGKDEADVEIVILGCPSRPGGPLQVSDVHKNGCKLKWKKPEDDGGRPIQHYAVEKLDTSTGRWVPVGRSTEPEIDVTGLQPGKEYQFRVKAVNEEGDSEPLETDHGTVAKNPYDEPGKPGTPQIADWDKNHVDLKWDPPKSDGGAPITGYVVEKKERFASTWEKCHESSGPKCETRVPDLKEGQQYQFRIRAVNKAGPGEPSEASQSVIAKPRHLAPKINREKLRPITVRAGQFIKLEVDVTGEPPPLCTWSHGDKMLENAQNVKIENEEYFTKIVISNVTRKDTGKYIIKATNESGTDEAPVEVNVLDKPGKPEGPIDITGVHKEGCKLGWVKPKDDGGLPIESYIVEKMEAGTGRWVPAGRTDKPEIELKGLEPGKKYHFRVKAVNNEGDSEPLETEKATLAKNPFDEPGAPGQPDIIDYDRDHVKLKWDRPGRDGGAPITGYIIEVKDRYNNWRKGAEVHGNVTEGVCRGLEEGQKYEFRVRAVNKAGPGEPSEPSKTFTAKPKHLRPRIDRTNLQNVTVKSGQSVSFDVNVIGEPPPKITWIFHDKELFSNEHVSIDNIDYNTKFFMLKSLRKFSGKYLIKATNDSGEDIAEVDVLIMGKPSKPNGPLEVSDVHKEGCKLKWTKPDDDGGTPIEYYEVEKMDTETGRWVPAGKAKGEEMDVTNLQPGKSYKFRVRAVNKEGESEELETEKSTVAKNPFDEPTKPGTPELTDWDSDHADLKWDKPDSDGGARIEKYVLERKERGTRNWVKAAEVPGDRTTGTVPGLEEGLEYEFRVVAVNKAGPSEPSDPSRTLVAKPRFLAPRIDRKNLNNVTLRVGQILRFDINIKGEPPPTKTWTYKGQPIKPDERFKIDFEDYNTTFMLTKLKRSDTGPYTITAKNNSGTDEVTVDVTVLSKPSSPQGPLKVSDVHAEGCKLKWEKPEDDGGEPVEQYVVERMDTETGRWVPVGVSKNPEIEISGLNPGKEYQFRVKAVNAEGESEPLTTDVPTLAKNPFDEPGKPGKPQVKDWDKHHAEIVWTKPVSDGGAPITSYIVEKKDKYSTKWQKAVEIIGDKCEATVPDLVEGMEYQFRVRAVNKAGPGEPSDGSQTMIAKARFLKPSIDRTHLKDVTIRAGQTFKVDVKVSGEPPPTKTWFHKDKKLQSGKQVSIETEDYRVKLTITNATRADSGAYLLTAENSSGKDEADIMVTVLDKPAKCEGPLKISDVHKEGCKLEWKKPTDDGGVPIDHYVVEKLDTETGRWVPAGRSNEPKMEVSNLQPGKEYKFRVMAVNQEGESEPLEAEQSIIAKNPFDEPGKPGTPEIADWDKTHVDLKWSPPTKDGGAPITGYIIEKKEKDGAKWVKAAEVTGKDCEARVPNLEEGQAYEFRVRAVNAAGPGEPSEKSKSVTCKPRRLPPKIDRKNLRSRKVKVGDEFFFDVKIFGEPPPNVTWTLDGKEDLDNFQNIRVVNVPYNSKLYNDKADRKASGNYVITAVNKYGRDEVKVEVNILSKPTKPEGPLEVSDIKKDGCKLKWNKPKDDGGEPIDAYLIEKLDPDTGAWIPCGKSSEPEMEVTGLTPGKEYKFRVKAVNKEGESEPLETMFPIVAKDPFTAPDSPGRPEAVDWSPNHVELKWTAPIKDGGTPITGYVIEKKEKGSPTWEKAEDIYGTDCKALVRHLQEGKEYEFRVAAVNKAGPGEPSDASKPVIAKHRFLAPKIDRKNLREVTISAGMLLKFDVNIEGEPPPTVNWMVGGKVLKESDHVMIENVDYNSKLMVRKTTRADSGDYTITATNNSGKDSVTVKVTVQDKPLAPEGPLEVSDVRKEGCKLKWKRPKDDGGTPIECYEVEKMDPETGIWVPVGTTKEPSMDVTGLTPNKQYKFRVKAVNKEGESAPLVTDAPITAKNPYDEPPKPGTPEVVDWDKDHADLKWDPPKEDGGAPITGYVIEKKDKHGNWEKALEVPADKTEATVGDLTEGQPYEFRVRAVNKAGPGEPSDASKQIIAKTRNLAPKIDRTNLIKVRIKAGQSFNFDVKVIGEPPPTITWTLKGSKVTNTDRIKVQVEDYNTKLWVKQAMRSDNGTYTITAENVNGKDVAEVEVTVLDKPGTPGGPLKVNDVHAEGCKLSWRPPDDDGGLPVDHYVVEKMDTTTGRWVPVGDTIGPETDMTVEGLQPGKEYKFRVKAVNRQGDSAPLTTSQGTVAKNPFDQPGKPGDPTIKDYDKDHVVLAWKPPPTDGGSPLTGYIVEKKDKYGNWEKAVEVPADATEAKVPDLIEGQAYEFRVKAVNKGGPGEPSNATAPHVARPKNMAPKIDRNAMFDVKVKAGLNFELDVPVLGEPPPTKKWILNDLPVQQNDRIKVTQEDYNTKFTVKNAKREDSGKYTLTATNINGTDTATVTVTVLDVPTAPEGPLRVDNVTKDGCVLSWKPPKDDGGADILGYAVEKMDAETGRWVPVGEAVGTQMKVDNLVEGHDYKFRVKAINRNGESAPLVTSQATTAKNPFDAPDKPGTPEVKDWDKDHVDLEWRAPRRDGGAPVEKYIIEKKKKDSPNWEKAAEVPGTATKGTAPNLTEGEEYEFRVIAVNKAGKGEPSDPSRSVVAKPRFLAPSLDLAALKDLKIRVGKPINFTVPIKGEPTPTAIWSINDKSVSSSTRIDILTTEKQTVFDIAFSQRTDSGKYSLTLKNSSGECSATANVTVLDRPSIPEGPLVVSNVTKETALLTWKASKDDGGSPIIHYIVEKMDVKRGTWMEAGTSSRLTKEVTKLIHKKEYMFRVKAVNSIGESDGLETDKGTIAKNMFDEPDAPGRPEIADWDKDHVDIKWAAPKSDGGTPITGYIIQKKERGSSNWVNAAEVPAGKTEGTAPNLIEGQEYEFRVIAKNKAGNSEPSEPSDAIIAKPRRLPPKITTPLKEVKIKAGNILDLDISFIGEPTPTVQWFINDQELKSGIRTTITAIGDHTVVHTVDAQRGDSGKYKLKLKNEHGTDEGSFEVIVLDKPAAPEGPLEVSDINKDSVALSWRPPKDSGGSEITAYVVEKRDLTHGGGWVPAVVYVDPRTTSVVVPKLIEGTQYEFRVMAENNQGTSEPLTTSKPVLAKNPYDVPSKPGTPEAVDASRDFIKIKWTPPVRNGGSTITGYDVERRDTKANRWVRVNSSPVPSTEYRDDRVTDSHRYEYRVIARNAAGCSDPSDPSRPIDAKPMKEKPKVHLEGIHGRTIRVRAGEPLTISVPISGSPIPKIDWAKEGVPLAPSNRVQTDTSDDTARLHIPQSRQRSFL